MSTDDPGTTAPPALPWLPAGCTTATLGAGRYGWDAVRIPRFWAHRVLDALGDRAGAVITEGVNMYLLVAHGTADNLLFPAAHGIAVLGDGTFVAVPGIDRTAATPGIDRLRWRTPPTEDGAYLTDVSTLQAAIDESLGPRRQAS